MPIVLSSFQALTASVAITLTGGRKAVEFFPFSENETVSHTGTLNLWKGFAVKPAAIPDFKQYAVFRDHLLNNVCDGDEALFKWVWAFFANMVQRPRDRPGVALVLRGGRGVGKTIVGEVFGGLLHPANHLLVDDARYVTGNFNMHFSCCLLLQADEAVWAGDKAAEGRLKGLITAPTQMIETKGVEPIQLKNYVRLLMTSNEHWVVPAGEDERRFAVLDVNPRYSNDDVYFKKMKDELWGRGGLEHLLGDLLAFDLSTVNLRRIPQCLIKKYVHCHP